MRVRIPILATLCLLLAAVPAAAQVLYDNGPINGTTDAWTINFGFVLANSFELLNDSTVGGFNFGAWEFAGDRLTSVDWFISAYPVSGTTYGSGTASGSNLKDSFISVNQYGYDIDEITVTGLNVNLNSGTYWLNLQNAVVPSGDPVYWDENSGLGCGGDDGHGGGCPSIASSGGVGSDPSEAFTIDGTGGGTTPEPGSFLLMASGVLALAGALRRKGVGSR